jgi:hypothetical protein
MKRHILKNPDELDDDDDDNDPEKSLQARLTAHELIYEEQENDVTNKLQVR